WKRRQGFDQDRLDLTSIDDPISHEIIGKFESAGLLVAIWDITTDIKIAAFNCLIMPRNEDMWHCAAAAGYGCYPARQIALLRALTEAAQTRLTIISGLRDDFRRDTYEQLLDLDVVKTVRDRILDSAPARSFRDVPSQDAETLEEDVEWELACLEKAG